MVPSRPMGYLWAVNKAAQALGILQYPECHHVPEMGTELNYFILIHQRRGIHFGQRDIMNGKTEDLWWSTIPQGDKFADWDHDVPKKKDFLPLCSKVISYLAVGYPNPQEGPFFSLPKRM